MVENITLKKGGDKAQSELLEKLNLTMHTFDENQTIEFARIHDFLA